MEYVLITNECNTFPKTTIPYFDILCTLFTLAINVERYNIRRTAEKLPIKSI